MQATKETNWQIIFFAPSNLHENNWNPRLSYAEASYYNIVSSLAYLEMASSHESNLNMVLPANFSIKKGKEKGYLHE